MEEMRVQTFDREPSSTNFASSNVSMISQSPSEQVEIYYWWGCEGVSNSSSESDEGLRIDRKRNLMTFE
jgi:hypothetical protein